MATLYIDPDGGNDNYGGTSFALLASGTNGRIASTTFSSVGASFPNDGSLIGQYLSIFNGFIYAVYRITARLSTTSLTITAITGGTSLANQSTDTLYYIGGRWATMLNGATAARVAPGDTVRFKASPYPTSLGINGKWTSGVVENTKVISAATDTTPIQITLAAHGYSTGDTITLEGVAGAVTANGFWEITVIDANTFSLDGSVAAGVRTSGGITRRRTNSVVILDTAVTQNIASTGQRTTAWTASANVSSALTTTTREHLYGDVFIISSGFTTGLAAYRPTGTLNLSGYQQVSFWIQQTSGTLATQGSLRLQLCSDSLGQTPVNTISIPAVVVLNRWQPVTVDLATNLGSNINSIALFVNTDLGAQTIILSNIIACKAASSPDSLTLNSLIGKNITGETFWSIQNINGRRVVLDSDTTHTTSSTNWRGYFGATGTVTTWKREAFRLTPAASAPTAALTIPEGGSSITSRIIYIGGWDRTNMSTQDGVSWFDGQNGAGYGMSMNFLGYLDVKQFAFSRFQYGLYIATCYNVIYDITALNNNNNGVFSFSNCFGLDMTVGHVAGSFQNAITFNSAISKLYLQHAIVSAGGTALDVNVDSYSTIRGSATFVMNNVQSVGAVIRAIGGKFYDLQLQGATQSISCSTAVEASLMNCNLPSATEVSLSGGQGIRIASQDHDQTPGNHKIFANMGNISSAVDERYVASGYSWKLQPLDSRASDLSPLILPLAKVACAANSLVTITAQMRINNAALTMRLMCKGGQISGVTTDVSAQVSTTNAWEQQTITFTPTQTGVVEITAEAWGGTTHSGWVDALTIAQA
jgi:hypothetical protein